LQLEAAGKRPDIQDRGAVDRVEAPDEQFKASHPKQMAARDAEMIRPP
jgi:hypothetical protein